MVVPRFTTRVYVALAYISVPVLSGQSSNIYPKRKRKLHKFVILECQKLGDNHIQNFHFGRYTSQNENFEYGYPHSNALLQFSLELEHCKPQKAARHPTKCDVMNDVKFLTLSNQTTRYKIKCIRMLNICHMIGNLF